MITLDNACLRFYSYAFSSPYNYNVKKREFKKGLGFFRPLGVQNCIDSLRKKINAEKKDMEANLSLVLLPAINALSTKIYSSNLSLLKITSIKGQDSLDNAIISPKQAAKRMKKIEKISISLQKLTETIKAKKAFAFS